jgi:hypothetical protein
VFDHRHGQISSLSVAGRGRGRGIGIGASLARHADGRVGLGAEELGAAGAPPWKSSRTAFRCAQRQEASAHLLGAPGSSEGCSWTWGPVAFVLGGGELVGWLWTGQRAAPVGVAGDEELHEMEVGRLQTAPRGDKVKGLVDVSRFCRVPAWSPGGRRVLMCGPGSNEKTRPTGGPRTKIISRLPFKP